MSNVIQTTNVYDVSKSRFISPLELRELIYQVISENQELLRGPRGFNGVEGPAGNPGQDGVDVTNVVNGYITVVIYKLAEERPTTPTFTNIDVDEAGATVAVSDGWSNNVYTTVPDDMAQWASDGTFKYDNHTGQWSLLRWQLPYLLEGSVNKLKIQIGDVVQLNGYKIIANALIELGYEITLENVRGWIEDEVKAQYGDSIAFVNSKIEAYASENLAYAADVETLSATVNGITAELDKQAYVVNGERPLPIDADSLETLSTLSALWEQDNTYLSSLGIIGRVTNPEGTREFYQYLGPNNGWRQTSTATGLTTFGSDKSLYVEGDAITGWSYLGGSGEGEKVSEFTINADNFRVKNSSTTNSITPFEIDATDPANPKIILTGKVVFQGVEVPETEDTVTNLGDWFGNPTSTDKGAPLSNGDFYTNLLDEKVYVWNSNADRWETKRDPITAVYEDDKDVVYSSYPPAGMTLTERFIGTTTRNPTTGDKLVVYNAGNTVSYKWAATYTYNSTNDSWTGSYQLNTAMQGKADAAQSAAISAAASDATSKANSVAYAAASSRNNMAETLGYASYADMETSVKANGKVIIEGGMLNADLINTTALLIGDTGGMFYEGTDGLAYLSADRINIGGYSGTDYYNAFFSGYTWNEYLRAGYIEVGASNPALRTQVTTISNQEVSSRTIQAGYFLDVNGNADILGNLTVGGYLYTDAARVYIGTNGMYITEGSATYGWRPVAHTTSGGDKFISLV